MVSDERQMSKNDKFIPLDKDTRQPHECSEVKEEGKEEEIRGVKPSSP
jgi:hypothetical protein